MRDLLFAARFLLALSWRTDRRRLLIGGGLVLLGYAATPVVAIALRGLVNAVIVDHGGAALVWAAVAGALLIAELQAAHFGHLFYFELGEINEARLTTEMLRLVNGSEQIDRSDDPAFADALTLLRQDISRMRECVTAVLQLNGLLLQAVITAVVLAQLQVWLLLLPLFAVVPVLTGKRAEQLLQRARETAAPLQRQLEHLRGIATSPDVQKEIRISGSQAYLLDRHDRAQRELDRVLGRAHVRHALLRGLGQAVFAAAFVTSVAVVFRMVDRGTAGPGDVILLVTLATQIGMQVVTGLELLATLHAVSAGYRRLITMRAEALLPVSRPELVLDRLAAGINLRGVSFRYPGAAADALREVDLALPAGRTVAVVGENGAGKSTLIKLLTGLYAPTSGRVEVDGDDLAAVDLASWRARTATLFQDFARLDLVVQESVGVGWLPDIDDPAAVELAFERASASSLLQSLPERAQTLLGTEYGDGRELSGGQWQSVGFARTLMRTDPLLVCLDEPGHSLDALAEERMCEAYYRAAREFARSTGAVTVFVTHRLSTVRLADLIVVLDQGAVTELGTHDELITAGGRYAELFRLQSHAYA
jgi:ATP-binding cassette subfamily B protein